MAFRTLAFSLLLGISHSGSGDQLSSSSGHVFETLGIVSVDFFLPSCGAHCLFSLTMRTSGDTFLAEPFEVARVGCEFWLPTESCLPTAQPFEAVR